MVATQSKTQPKKQRAGASATASVLATIAISLSAGLIVCIGAVQADEPITIGGALCLTGIQAPLDAPGLKGAELAVKAINEKGRRPRSSAQVR
jgi:ABC-type branched-subunit amino acid transport system substrate-binding protein